MSEEEKKAIDWLKNTSLDPVLEYENDIKSISIVLNLIDKQQKEIEVLKAIINKEHENNLDKRYVELKFISKDKIREKIEDYAEKSKHPLVNSQSRREYTFGIRALKELLGGENE